MRHAVTEYHPPHSHVGDVRSVPDTEEVPSSKSLGEARLWETPYKHVVRHAVTEYHPPHSHIGDVRSVVDKGFYICILYHIFVLSIPKIRYMYQKIEIEICAQPSE